MRNHNLSNCRCHPIDLTRDARQCSSFQRSEGSTFFFIDGSHTYHYCKSDSEKCYALCDGKGVFVWHNCNDNHPGVLEFIAEWRKMGREIVRLENTPLCYWSSL